MSRRIVVVGAALIQADDRKRPRLFVAKQLAANNNPGYWELVGGPVYTEDDEKEKDILLKVFRDEFSLEVRFDIKIGLERTIQSWVDRRGNSKEATLRVWRTQLAFATTLNMAAGEPRPRLLRYDDAAWIPLDSLDEVSSWRPEDRMVAEEIRGYYYGDDVWQRAVLSEV